MKERGELFAVFLASSAIFLILWAGLPHEAFFTIDSGVKFIQVHNLVASHYSTVTLQYNGKDIDPRSTISPFQIRPSVYVKGGRNYSVFPILFPLLSSLFYVAMGFAGLYVLPLCGGLLCIPLAYAIAKHFVPHRAALSASVFAVFATPMFFYSLTFWEHTPAVCLLLAAILLLMKSDRSISVALTSGLLLGMSVWLRSEMLVFSAMLCISGLLLLGRPRVVGMVAAGMTVPLVALLLTNKTLYGEWYGHVVRNLHGSGLGVTEVLRTRMSCLWISLFGMNAPQTLSAAKVEKLQSAAVVKDNLELELLAMGALAGVAACAVTEALCRWRRARCAPVVACCSYPAKSAPWTLVVSSGMLLVLGCAAGAYIATFALDLSPLISVLKSGGVFSFSPFLAVALMWPFLPFVDRAKTREFLWLFCAGAAFVVVMPLLAPNDGGIRYGARYLLPAICVMAILAVVVFHGICKGPRRKVFRTIMFVLVALSLLIEARGYQILYHKKVFSRNLTASLMASPSARIAALFWWIPFEAPRLIVEKKVHMIFSAEAMGRCLEGARRAGDRTIDVVLPGRIGDLPAVEGTVCVDRREVTCPFDDYFNATIFRLVFLPEDAAAN